MGDSFDLGGAIKLKKTIEEYWFARGFVVKVEVVEAGYVPAIRSTRYDVRSNLVNGKPPEKRCPAIKETAPLENMRGRISVRWTR